MGKIPKSLPSQVRAWTEARQRYHLSHGLVRADQDAVGAGSGWLRSPAMLARVVEQRFSFKARETRVPDNNAVAIRRMSQ